MTFHMMDRLLARALNLTVMGLIVASAIGALVLGYRGLLRIVGSHPGDGVAPLVLGIGLAVLCIALCRHRHELADS
jgi:hypothetical protein